MKKTILYVNAGHGGRNPKTGEYTTPASNGKRTYHTNGQPYHDKGWFYEGVLNRQLAALFIAEATAKGYTCVSVYDAIEDTSLAARVAIANNHFAKYAQPSLWVSFHSNAFKGQTRGFNVFHFPSNANARQLAANVSAPVNAYFENLGSLNKEFVREGWGWRNNERFVLYELQETRMPALLFEWLFFDNAADADLLMKPHVREDSVSILVENIEKFLP